MYLVVRLFLFVIFLGAFATGPSLIAAPKPEIPGVTSYNLPDAPDITAHVHRNIVQTWEEHWFYQNQYPSNTTYRDYYIIDDKLIIETKDSRDGPGKITEHPLSESPFPIINGHFSTNVNDYMLTEPEKKAFGFAMIYAEPEPVNQWQDQSEQRNTELRTLNYYYNTRFKDGFYAYSLHFAFEKLLNPLPIRLAKKAWQRAFHPQDYFGQQTALFVERFESSSTGPFGFNYGENLHTVTHDHPHQGSPPVEIRPIDRYARYVVPMLNKLSQIYAKENLIPAGVMQKYIKREHSYPMERRTYFAFYRWTENADFQESVQALVRLFDGSPMKLPPIRKGHLPEHLSGSLIPLEQDFPDLELEERRLFGNAAILYEMGRFGQTREIKEATPALMAMVAKYFVEKQKGELRGVIYVVAPNKVNKRIYEINGFELVYEPHEIPGFKEGQAPMWILRQEVTDFVERFSSNYFLEPKVRETVAQRQSRKRESKPSVFRRMFNKCEQLLLRALPKAK